MSLAIKSVSTTQIYRGSSEINFFSDDNSGLSVTIDTERLHIRSVQSTDEEYDRYAHLFGDQAVMCKVATGQTKTIEEMQSRINDVWVKCWRENDPYTGFAVFKKDSDDFLGHIALGHSGAPGKSKLSCLFHQAQWGKGYGSEAVKAVVTEYAPATVGEGYTLDGKTLEKIVATARHDNPASGRILEKVGMHHVGSEERDGALRHLYSMDLSVGINY
jgi:RimJ/RimL family protein N-acetyltransferase